MSSRWQHLTQRVSAMPGADLSPHRLKYLTNGLLSFMLLGASLLALSTWGLQGVQRIEGLTQFGLVIGPVIAVFLLIHLKLKRPIVPGTLLVFGLATLLALGDYPQGFFSGSTLFFFSLPILCASIVIRPTASFWLAIYCTLLLILLPMPTFGLEGTFQMFKPVVVGGFFLLATCAWGVTKALELAVTRQRQITSQLITLLEQHETLKQVDEDKDQFLLTLSHELRAPMSAMRFFLQPLIGAERQENLRLVHDEISRLSDLVGDLLSLARLEQQNSRVFTPIDLNQLVQRVGAPFQAEAQGKGLAWVWELSPSLPPLSGNPAQLAEVVQNLVANAVHYTENGQVRVRTANSAVGIVLEVADTGLGIAPEDVPHIFERLFRGVRTSHVPGTGLGLALVKTIITQHRGEIAVQSTPGSGTMFTVVLPI
jgi:signal transduction histidine kinase